MKKQLALIWKFLFPFAKVFKIILLLLFFITHFSIYAQKIISREPADYPGGEVPVICATDYTNAACVIILPPSLPDGTYNFQIPLGSEPGYLNESIGNCSFTIIQTTPCESGNMILDDTGGNINMPADTRCNPVGDNNYLEIEVLVNIISGDNIGQSDNQKYRLPIYRDPVKVALVLDISGSMGWPIPGGTEIRWNVLKDAVELFVEKLEIEQQVGDEIALTYFTDYVIQPNSPIGSNFIDITPDETLPVGDRSFSIIKADMEPPRGPLDCTAMGLGLLDGKSKLGNNDPIGARKIVLLFTDGLQNINPKVNSDGITFNTVPDKLNDCPCDELDSIYYYPIGLGSSILVPAILAEIADANGGIALSITAGESTEPEIHNFFQNQFANMLEGGSPQIVGRKIGDLSSGDMQHSFKINNVVSRVFFELIHDEEANIDISIKKDGIDLSTNLIETTGDFYKIINVEFPIITDTVIYGGGEWEVTVSGESANRYYLTCFTDDHFLKYPSNLDASIYKTGDTIKFSSYLKYAGEPLSSENDSVSVVLIKPGDDIGHLLATYATELTDTLEDYTDDAQNKLTTLLNNDESFYAALLPEEQVINLENNGNGEFSGYFTNTDVTGVYQALFLIKGEIPSIGNFERIKQLSAVMEFGQVVGQTPEVVSDNETPSTPTNLSATSITQSSLELNWGASTDDIGVIEYKIYKNGDFLSGTLEPNTNIIVYNLDANANYSFYIKAIDASGKLSDSSNEITITTLNIQDVEKPTIPNNLTASDIAQTSLYLGWDVSADNIGVVEYEILQNGEPVASTSNNSYSITGLTTGTAYAFWVIAKDAALNESDPSNKITITTLDQPVNLSYPTKLTATNITPIGIDLSWNASKGNNGDIKYKVYQDAYLIGNATNTTYSVANLKALTKYTFYVIAEDAEGNISDVSNTIEVTTLNATDDTDKYGIVILKIRPINKFGYYMGPGFKSKIKFKYLPKEPGIAYTTSILYASNGQEQMGDPYLKNIVDNLDGSYYLVLANVALKTNPRIEISIGDEVVHSGPIYKIPMWFYILLIIVIIFIMILLLMKKKKSKTFRTLWSLLVVLIVIWILHYTGQLFFLYLI